MLLAGGGAKREVLDRGPYVKADVLPYLYEKLLDRSGNQGQLEGAFCRLNWKERERW